MQLHIFSLAGNKKTKHLIAKIVVTMLRTKLFNIVLDLQDFARHLNISRNRDSNKENKSMDKFKHG